MYVCVYFFLYVHTVYVCMYVYVHDLMHKYINRYLGDMQTFH